MTVITGRSGEETETKIKAEVELIDCVWEYHACSGFCCRLGRVL